MRAISKNTLAKPHQSSPDLGSMAGELVTTIAVHCRDRKTMAAFLGTCSYFHGFAESLLAPAKSLYSARVPERSLRLAGTLDAIARFGKRICAQDWKDHLDALEKQHADDAQLMCLAALVPDAVPDDSEVFQTSCERLGDFHAGLALDRLAKQIPDDAQAWGRVTTAVILGCYEQAGRMTDRWNILDFNMLVWTLQECAQSMPLDLTLSILGQMAEKGQLNALYKENLVGEMLVTMAQLISTPGRSAQDQATPAFARDFFRALESIFRAAHAQRSTAFIQHCAENAEWFVKVLPMLPWRAQPREDLAWAFELASAVLLLDERDQHTALLSLRDALVNRGNFSQQEWDAVLKHLHEGGPDPRD